MVMLIAAECTTTGWTRGPLRKTKIHGRPRSNIRNSFNVSLLEPLVDVLQVLNYRELRGDESITSAYSGRSGRDA